jgi:cytochrome c peroxidase
MSLAKVELGRALFFDRQLSVNGTRSCADCHRPEQAFTDGRARAVGATGESHARGAMSLLNAAYSPALTWIDPGAPTLERQMRQPLFGTQPIEMGLGGREAVVLESLATDPRYRAQFEAAYPLASRRPTVDQIIQAIASYERTLIAGRSAVDRHLFGAEPGALSAAARRGLALFASPRFGCAGCHSGLNFNGPIRSTESPRARAAYANTSVTPNSRRRFRVPTLRNVTRTAPYMHDGSLETLDRVLDHYAAGGRHRDFHTERRLRPIANLSAAERRDLVAFLAALSEESVNSSSAGND